MISFKEFFIQEQKHSQSISRITKRMGQTRQKENGDVYNTGVNMAAKRDADPNDPNRDPNLKYQKNANELASDAGLNVHTMQTGEVRNIGKSDFAVKKLPNGTLMKVPKNKSKVVIGIPMNGGSPNIYAPNFN